MDNNIFQKLNTNRKIVAAGFALLSAMIITALCFVFRNDLAIPILLIILVIHIALSIVLWFKGIAKGLKWAVYYLLFVLCISLAVTLEIYVKLPKGVGTGVFSNFTILVLCVIIQVIKTPQKIQERIEAKLGKEKKADVAKLSLPVTNHSQVNYGQMHKYKSTTGYISKSYALGNASPIMQKMRRIIGGVLFISGMLGLLLATELETEANTVLELMAPWLLVLCGGAVLCGCTIMFFGFKRTLVVPPIYAALIAVSYLCYLWISKTMAVNLTIGIVLLILIVILAFTLFGCILYKLAARTSNTFTFYERENCLIGVDIELKDLCPIMGYFDLITVKITPDINANSNILAFLDHFNKDLNQLCGLWKLLFCGFELDFETGIYMLYIYQGRARQERISKFVSKRFRSFEMNQKCDEEWQEFKRLLPNPYESAGINNNYLVNSLEKEGFDFMQEVPQIFQLTFTNKIDAELFKAENEYNFESVLFIDNTEDVIEYGFDEKYNYHMYLQLTSKLGMERMNINTRNIIDLAKQYNGELIDWMAGELTEESIEKQ